jgi:(2S)-methylsuccinyl-CoA dehydrogenase
MPATPDLAAARTAVDLAREVEIRPVAEEIHRRNEDIPERIIQGLAEIGTFGVSVPEEYGGFAASGEGEYLAMVVATEELSRGSLGVGGRS